MWMRSVPGALPMVSPTEEGRMMGKGADGECTRSDHYTQSRKTEESYWFEENLTEKPLTRCVGELQVLYCTDNPCPKMVPHPQIFAATALLASPHIYTAMKRLPWGCLSSLSS